MDDRAESGADEVPGAEAGSGGLFIDEEEEEEESGRRRDPADETTERHAGGGPTAAPLVCHPHLREMDELLRSYEEAELGSPLPSGRTDDDESAEAEAWLRTAAAPPRRTRGRRDAGGSVPGALTSAGSQLSGTMEEYQTHLQGVLALLESCMDEAGVDLDPRDDWATPPTDQNRDWTEEGKGAEPSAGVWVSPGDTEARLGEWVVYTKTAAETGACVDIRVDLGGGGGACPAPSATSAGGREGGVGSGDEEEEETGGHAAGDAEAGPGPQGPGGYEEELAALGARFEGYMEEVGRLTRRREELVGEVLELRGEEGRGQEESAAAELLRTLEKEAQGRREDRLREADGLRRERGEEEGRLARARLEKQGLQEEARRLRRRLFAVARDCAHSQLALATQQREVDHFNQQQEELQSHVAQLKEELSQLGSAHQDRITSLQAQLQSQARASSRALGPQDEFAQCRRRSCGDIQQYLQGGLRALEDRYEPMLLGLLKRREGAAEGVARARGQAQELRARLGPLRAECQRLGLQRACLEERLKLTDAQRREDVEQYRDRVSVLEETSRELRTELLVQKRKTKEMEELNDSLTRQILLYRDTIQNHKKCDVTAATMRNET